MVEIGIQSKGRTCMRFPISLSSLLCTDFQSFPRYDDFMVKNLNLRFFAVYTHPSLLWSHHKCAVWCMVRIFWSQKT